MDTRSALERARQEAKQGNRSKAREILREAAKSDPKNEEIYLLFAQVADTKLNAIKALEYVLKLNPNNQTARNWLVKIQQKPVSVEPSMPPRSKPKRWLWGIAAGVIIISLCSIIVVVFGPKSEKPSESRIVATATKEQSPQASQQAELTTEDQTATEEPSVITEPSPTLEPTAMPMLGDLLELYGYSLSALTVEDPATKPGIFYEPQEGMKLVAVEFIVGNVSGETFSSNVLYATLIDTEGFAYGAETGVVDNQLQLLDLNSGEKVLGWSGFVIPQEATPASLKYAIRGSSEKVLQVSLKSPEGIEVQGEPVPTYTPNPNLPRLGDVVENYGYSLSAVTVEDPATKPGIFYEPQEGMKLVAVEFIVGNVSSETFSSNVLYATLIDTHGFAYGAETGVVDNQLELLDVNSGEKVRGWAGFVIPQEATPASLKYAIRGSSEKVLQVRLIGD